MPRLANLVTFTLTGRCMMHKQGTAERHPWSLKWLFSIEMWERFGFYLMLGLLTLFLMDTKGGFGYSEDLASEIYGTFLALCYVTPFFGAMLAERIFGFRKTVLLGAVLMMIGYFLLATVTSVTFFLGLGLIVLGNGLFKPNISAMLGKFYEDGSKLVDSGYKIFYMGINIAGLFCNFIAAFLRHNYGWDFAFAGAGVGMGLSTIIILLVYKRLAPIDALVEEQKKQPRDPNEVGFAFMGKWVLPPMVLLGGGGYYLFGLTWAVLLAFIPILVFYFFLWASAKKEEKGPLGALLILLVVAMPFFTLYGLNGAALNYWARDNTDRQMNSEVINWTMNTFQFAEEVDSESPYFEIQSKITPLPAKGEKVRLLSTELFQSVNPFFIITLIPLIELLMGFLRRRKRAPSTPVQMGIGLIFAAFGMLVMFFATKAGVSPEGTIFKVSPWWLVSTYFFLTAAECFVSPVGLTLVRQMSPKRFTAVMMGGFFIISIAIGVKLAGVASGLWNTIDHDTLFMGLMVYALFFAGLVFSLSKWLNKYIPQTSE